MRHVICEARFHPWRKNSILLHASSSNRREYKYLGVFIFIYATYGINMSDYDSYYTEDEYEDNSSVEFSDSDSIALVDSHQDSNYKIMYSFPTSKTSMGRPTHRMKYQTLNIDDIQKKLLKSAENLSTMLHLDTSICLILLCKYEWKEDRLLDDYMNARDIDEFFKKFGLIKKYPKDLLNKILTTESDPNVLCRICYCGPEPGQSMEIFSLASCSHKYCTDCYIQYVEAKNKDMVIYIECPFFDPKCGHTLTLLELQILSDYNEKRQANLYPEKINKMKFILEEEVKKMYNLSEGEDEYEDSNSDAESNPKTYEVELNRKVYDYQQEMRRREREETEAKRNRSLISKYWYNVNTHYCVTHSKHYKHCPYPDCDSVVEFLGFDSDLIASIEEQKALLLVPLVKCGNKHQFCFGCKELSHSPCPCIAVDKWQKKCQDDSETLNWLQSNTKDCPKCNTMIEKNGGCNHMTCRKCNWEFCWICMGDWSKHRDNYRCDQYVASDKNENADSVRASLARYTFYFNVFNNQRLSYEKDREMLSKFEVKIKEVEPSVGASWMETSFYKECISMLLECRLTLKWSYAFLFFVPTCRGKNLIETAQWQLSNKVEEMSKLFQDVEICDVMKRKSSFLKIKSAMLIAKEKFLETCIDIFSDQTTMIHIKSRINAV